MGSQKETKSDQKQNYWTILEDGICIVKWTPVESGEKALETNDHATHQSMNWGEQEETEKEENMIRNYVLRQW